MRLSSHYSTLRIAGPVSRVPPAPGEIPIPTDHVRLYHYTTPFEGESDEQAAKKLSQEGIDIGQAQGHTYGEPNLVWASTQLPRSNRVYAEFSMHKDDPRWDIGKPRTPEDIEWLYKRGSNVTFGDSIRPEEILAVHLPWHHIYRELKEEDQFSEVINGKYDYFLGDPRRRAEEEAINYIKSHHGV